jgi:phenylalanyl-tRNA synthetase beta chain
MRISVHWLNEWLATPVEARDLATRLTMAGLEVEAIEPAAPPLAGVVVGEIVEREKHPNADSLSVCKVNAGGELLQIVCGAPNARAGMKAPLATVGTTMPGGMVIKQAKLRGVESHGMLCSARELGLAEDASGLMELPAELRTGESLTTALGLDDTLIEINLTPNRGDCMGVLGVAREAAVLTGAALAGPQLHAVHAQSNDRFPVELAPGAGCARFAARVIRGVRPDAQAPMWMRERLRRAGLRPISAVVDVTNYVMLELGQPMHAYDLRELEGGIVVRRARADETLRLLDGREITLDETVLVIADHAKPLGLAGVMGGDHSGIGDDTTDVLLEVAYFQPQAIAGRGRRYGLVTDASQRFERGVDPTLQERAIERATELLLACAGGTPGPTEVTELPAELPHRTAVSFRPGRARRVIGADIADADIERILRQLGMQVVEHGGAAWRVTPPPWRFDIAIEEDLIEEVARIHGFDHIPETDPATPLAIPAIPETRVTPETVADLLVQRGYFEAITYSFVDPDLQAVLCPGEPALRLANPISADLAEMRVSLWPGLVRALIENQRRQQPRVRLFEIGRKFRRRRQRHAARDPGRGRPCRGPALAEQWGTPSADVDFFDVRSDVEALLRSHRVARRLSASCRPRTPRCTPGRARGSCATASRWAGWAALHPEVARRLELTYSAVLFEIETESGLEAAVPQFSGISRFPAVRRDLAVLVAEAVPVQALLETVKKGAGALLTGLVVFDIYRGRGIAEGFKSVAIGLNLQDISRTLTDEETDAVVAQVVTDLEREHSATIRDK